MGKLWLFLVLFGVGLDLAYNKTQDSCGQRNIKVKRIVGGRSSSLWPWTGALIAINKDVTKLFCGASLISQNWAVTAAHCVHNIPLDLPIETFNQLAQRGRFHVLFGEVKYDKRVMKSESFRKIKKAIMMDAFNDTFYDYDLALLQLHHDTEIPFREPVCLDDGHFKVGDECVVMGWGSTDNTRGPFPNTLQKAVCPITSDSKCLELYTAEYFNERQFCFGFEDVRRGVCTADSGGPVVCQKDGVWYLTAVVSAAYLKINKRKPYLMDCAWPGYYQKHTKISHPEIRQWIKQHTGL